MTIPIGPHRRIRPLLLVLLWIWATCVFVVVDLFFNVDEFDGIRPRAPLYRGMRRAAHRMVGETCEETFGGEPVRTFSEPPRLVSLPPDPQLAEVLQLLRSLPGLARGDAVEVLHFVEEHPDPDYAEGLLTCGAAVGSDPLLHGAFARAAACVAVRSRRHAVAADLAAIALSAAAAGPWDDVRSTWAVLDRGLPGFDRHPQCRAGVARVRARLVRAVLRQPTVEALRVASLVSDERIAAAALRFLRDRAAADDEPARLAALAVLRGGTRHQRDALPRRLVARPGFPFSLGG